MSGAPSAHLQEDIVLPAAAYQQVARNVIEGDGIICCLYTTMSA